MGVVTEVLASTPMALVMGASAPATGEALGIERFGLYLAADDLDRSTAFHEALFGEEPQVRNEGPRRLRSRQRLLCSGPAEGIPAHHAAGWVRSPVREG